MVSSLFVIVSCSNNLRNVGLFIAKFLRDIIILTCTVNLLERCGKPF